MPSVPHRSHQKPLIGKQLQRLGTDLVSLSLGGIISPEQYEGAPGDAASDQFSFCAALYEALYGHLPFAGVTAAEQSASISGPPRPPAPDSAVPPEVFHILSRGLAREPEARFPSMAALLRSLQAEYEQSAAAATRSRRALIAVVAVGCLSVWLLLQYLLSYRARIVPQAMVLSLGLIGVALGAGYWHRTTLRTNPFHLGMWALILTTFVQNFFVRLLFVIRPQLPVGAQLMVEMLVWGGTSLTMALTLIRQMWWVPVLPLGVGTLAIALDPPPRRLLLCAYPVIVGLVLWHWLRASRSVADKPEGRSGASG